MPNYVTNLITLNGPDEKIDELIKQIAFDGRPGTFDFNKVIPMPASLDLVEGGITETAVNAYLSAVNPANRSELSPHGKLTPEAYAEALQDAKAAFNRSLRSDSLNDQQIAQLAEQNKIGSPQALVDLGKQYLDNYQEHGAMTWYDWRTENWGTKWNNTPETIVTNEMANQLTFETAWSMPDPIFKELSRQYPELTIDAHWADEGLGYDVGIRSYEKGNLVYEHQPEPDSEEAMEMAFDIKGPGVTMKSLLQEAEEHAVQAEGYGNSTQGGRHASDPVTYPVIHSKEMATDQKEGQRYEYDCSVVVYGRVKVVSDQLLSIDEAFEQAAKQVEAIDPTGTFQVEKPEIPDDELVICTKTSVVQSSQDKNQSLDNLKQQSGTRAPDAEEKARRQMVSKEIARSGSWYGLTPYEITNMSQNDKAIGTLAEQMKAFMDQDGIPEQAALNKALRNFMEDTIREFRQDFVCEKLQDLRIEPGKDGSPGQVFLGEHSRFFMDQKNGLFYEDLYSHTMHPVFKDIRALDPGDGFFVGHEKAEGLYFCITENLDNPNDPGIVYDTDDCGWYASDISKEFVDTLEKVVADVGQTKDLTLDSLKQEAKERANEKNQAHDATKQDRKPPEMNR